MNRTFLAGCVGVGGLALVGGMAWRRYLTAPAVVAIPPQNLPAQNARDGYLAAAAAMVASPLLDDPGAGTLAGRQAVLAENVEALHLLRQALALPYCAPRSTATHISQYSAYRRLARLLALEASVYGDRGEWDRAARSALDAMQMGSSLSHGAPLIDMLVGASCEGIGRKSVREVLPHLDAAEARAVAARLQAIAGAEVSFADTLTEEKHWMQIRLQEDPGPIFVDVPPAGSLWRRVSTVLFTSRRRAMADLIHTMDRLVADARRPYAIRPPVSPSAGSVLGQGTLRTCMRSWFMHTRNRANNALLLVELGLQTYRVEHGGYPDRLDQLVPAHLPVVPKDPFATEGSLRYRRAGEGYVLYSIGPDGKDDGGKPIHNPGCQGRQATLVEESSIGDMVAGVNW